MNKKVKIAEKKYLKWVMLCIILISRCTLSVNAEEKESVVSISKEYTQIKFTITCDGISELDTKIISPSNREYEVSIVDDNTVECIVDKAKDQPCVAKGEWRIIVSNDSIREKMLINQQESDNGESLDQEGQDSEGEVPEEVIPNIGAVKVVVEGSKEKIVEADRNIVIATDIVGLVMYFRDDTFVVEWTDTSCGDVEIKVTNAGNMQVLDKQTVKGNLYEFDIDENKVSEIFVEIVPLVSRNIEGAANSYDISVYNHPNGTITYEDLEITNRDTIIATATLEEDYSIEIWNNGKLQEKTDVLTAGTHDFDLVTEVGDNDYLIYIVDEKGNKRSTAKHLQKDVVAPYLQFVQEYMDIITSNPSITIEGRVEEQDYFRINDLDVQVEGDHTFKYEYKLKEGLNRINIVAGDIAGNIQEYNASVTYVIPVEDPVDVRGVVLFIGIGVFLVLIVVYNLKKRRKGDMILDEDDPAFFEDKGNSKEKANKEEKGNSVRLMIKLNKYAVRNIVEMVTLLITGIVLLKVLMSMTVIQSNSMEPTLMTGDTVFFNKLAYVRKDISRGDIIAFWSDEQNALFAKRVIGLPGDNISFMDGYVNINGKFADESEYIGEDVETNSIKSFTVPDGCYFVLGDNRENSFDSRFFDNPYIKRESIKGKFLGKIGFSIQSLLGSI
ncbi:MAG: signal peptidase I [Lachnospiraceae bacterium]|nr:signal peptidase I [Lachnospiraceae bacterium]